MVEVLGKLGKDPAALPPYAWLKGKEFPGAKPPEGSGRPARGEAKPRPAEHPAARDGDKAREGEK